MSDVHQCPFCELRFVNLAELNFHIQFDHPDRQVPEREYSISNFVGQRVSGIRPPTKFGMGGVGLGGVSGGG